MHKKKTAAEAAESHEICIIYSISFRVRLFFSELDLYDSF